jgi:hypothetical protein
MMRRVDKGIVRVGVLCLAVGAIVALTSGVAGAGFRFRVNVNYVSGVQDLYDQFKDNITADVYDNTHVLLDEDELDTFDWPVGIALSPYYQWDNGLMLGGQVGPFMFLYGSVETFGGFDDFDQTYIYWEVPLNLTIGYNFFADGPVSPYIRVGPSYHLAGGDFYESSKVGVIVAGGVELLKTSHFALGLEAAYDTAAVEIDNVGAGGTKDIRSAEFTAGLFFQFQ